MTMERITLALNATKIETRNQSVSIRGDYSFQDKSGTFTVQVIPDVEHEDWILCTGRLDGNVPRDFATIRSAHELHRGLAWMVTQQKLIWNDLQINTEENLMGQIDMALKGEIAHG